MWGALGRYARFACAIAFIACTPAAVSQADPTHPVPTLRTRVPVATAAATVADIERWFILPIEGAALPDAAELYPESSRAYRAGRHEGIDFPAAAGTPVRAAAEGIVVRVDREFFEWSAEEREAALANARALGRTPPATLDRIRGRQVWVDHGHGVVTRYAHLSGVSELQPGMTVDAGLVVGAVGSSGLPEGGPHLHFEVRVGDGYLGEGLAPADAMAAIARAFRGDDFTPLLRPGTQASAR